jgi:hypothetical protein
MKFSENSKYLIFILLIILNIILRIPSTPHTGGDNDQFVTIALANSLTEFGYAKWWLHPLSIFGFYPYSYASSTMFLYSGFSQLTGLKIDNLLFLYSIILGIFSVFTAYLMAQAIYNDDLFKFLVAFGFSVSPGILAYTTSTLMTRLLLMSLVPLLIFLFLKSRDSIFRYGLLIPIIFLFLFSTHHLVWYTLPIFFAYILITTIYRFKLRRFFRVFRIPNYEFLLPLFGFLFMFSIPFFTRVFMERSRYSIGTIDYVRYLGFLFVFAVSGFVYIILKQNKSFEEWFLVSTLIFTTIFIYQLTYIKWFYPIYGSLLAGISLRNLSNIKRHNRYKIYALIVSIVLVVSFSSFYQHWRTSLGGQKVFNWYVEETTYAGSEWIGNNIIDGRLMCSEFLTSRIMSAYAGVPTFIQDSEPLLLTYGFASNYDIKIAKNSPMTEEFYRNNPYVDVTHPKLKWYSNKLGIYSVDSTFAKEIIERFKLSHAIGKRDVIEKRGRRRVMFFHSLSSHKNKIYDNGKIFVHSLN